MDDDIKKQNVQVDANRQKSLFEYQAAYPIPRQSSEDVSVLTDQEKRAIENVKKIRENSTSNPTKYPWEDLDYNQTDDNIPIVEKKKYEKRTINITPQRLIEIQAKNKSETTYITKTNVEIKGMEKGASISIITAPKFSGSIGSLKQYKVSGKPDIFIQEINPLSIKIAFTINRDGTFKKRNAGEWLKGDKNENRSAFNNFMNFSFFEPNTRPTGVFIVNGRNYGERTDKADSWSNAPVLYIRPGQVPLFDRAGNWYNAYRSNEVFAEKSGKHGFISDNVSKITGESVVAANIPLFFQNGNMNTEFHSSQLGAGAYNARNFVGSLNNGNWFVGTASGGGNRKKSANGYDVREVAQALNKIYINKIVNAIGTDSGGSTTFVSNGQIIEGSTNGRAIPTILAW